jgi:hypothetical protein
MDTDFVCDNEACHLKHQQSDKRVTCSLCLNPVYCSEACRIIDWPSHACPNVHNISSAAEATLFTPYFYQDMAPAEVLQASLANPQDPLYEQHLLVQHGVDMVVTQQLIGDDAVAFKEVSDVTYAQRGGPPPESIRGREYIIIIESIGDRDDKVLQTVAVRGSVSLDSIYKENKPNKVAVALAGGFLANRKKSTDSVLFWPGVKQFERQQFLVDPIGTLRFTLKITGKPDVELRGGYDVRSVDGTMSRLTQSLFKFFQNRLQTKFKADGGGVRGVDNTGIKYMRVLHGYKAGVHVFVTLKMPDNEYRAQIVDVEYMVPNTRFGASSAAGAAEYGYEYDEVKTSFSSPSTYDVYCDPTNLADLQGLTMALELRKEPALDQHAATIRSHMRKVLDAKNGDELLAAPSDEVRNAVFDVVQALYSTDEHVGVRFSFMKHGKDAAAQVALEKKLKSFTTQEEYQKEFDMWLADAKSIIDEGGEATVPLRFAKIVKDRSYSAGGGKVVKHTDKLRELDLQAKANAKAKRNAKKE